MGKGRPPGPFERYPTVIGFKASPEERQYLDEARAAAGAPTISEWLRELAFKKAEAALRRPPPPRSLRRTKRGK